MECNIKSYNPTYIITEHPNRFGFQQDDYLRKSETIIGKIA